MFFSSHLVADSEPNSDEVIKYLLEQSANPDVDTGTSSIFRENPNLLEQRVDTLLERFFFDVNSQNHRFTAGEKATLRIFILDLAGRTSPYPFAKDGSLITSPSQTGHDRDKLLKQKIAQVKKALFEVMQEISLRANFKDIILQNQGGKVTMSETYLPSLGMWLYFYLIALQAGQPGYFDRQNYDHPLSSPNLATTLKYLLIPVASGMAFFYLATKTLIHYLNVEAIQAYLSAGAGTMLTAWVLLTALDHFDPFQNPKIRAKLPTELFKSASSEGALLKKMKRVFLSIRHFESEQNTPSRDYARQLMADRLSPIGPSSIRNFLSDGQEALNPTGESEDPIRSFLNTAIIFENGECAKSIRKGETVVFSQGADLF